MAAHSSFLTWKIPWTEKPGEKIVNTTEDALHNTGAKGRRIMTSFSTHMVISFEKRKIAILMTQVLQIRLPLIGTGRCRPS